jgi:hypothetical protein
MVAKLLQRLAGRLASTGGGDATLAGQYLSVGRGSGSGPVAYTLPSAWVKMHVWRRDQGRCVSCGGQEGVWFNYVVPPWEGGSVSEQNIRLMCGRCGGRSKGLRIRRKKSGD